MLGRIDELSNPCISTYGKPCGSKIESTKRTVIMPKNVRVLAINVRVSLYRYVFLQRKVFYYKRTCFIINVRVSINVRVRLYLASNPGRYFNRPGLEARLYLKHLASDRVASIQGRLESRLVTERLAQKAKMKHVRL